MVDNMGTSIEVSIEKNAQITNSEVGVVKNENHYHGPSFESNYQQAKESVYNDLEDIEPQYDGYYSAFEIFDNINDYLQNHIEEFKTIMRQICCGKANIPTSIQIRYFLIFCLKVAINSDLDIEIQNVSIDEKNCWLFTPHEYSPISVEMAMAKILSFFNKYKNSDIKNGVCFVANILNDGRLDCTRCIDGALNVEEDIHILNDFMNTNQPIKFRDTVIQKDYFEIHTSRNLTFKCGNCVTSIEKFEESQRVLGRDDS